MRAAPRAFLWRRSREQVFFTNEGVQAIVDPAEQPTATMCDCGGHPAAVKAAIPAAARA